MKYIYTFAFIILSTMVQSQSLITLINNHSFNTDMDAEVINNANNAVIATASGLSYVEAGTALTVPSGTTIKIKWYTAGTATLLNTTSAITLNEFTENIALVFGNSAANFNTTIKEVEVLVDFTKVRLDAINSVPGSSSENFILRSSQQLIGDQLTYPNGSQLLSAQLPVADYILDITPGNDIYNGLFAYQLDVTNYAGYYIYLFTSGPVDDQDCYAWIQDGSLVNLPQLPPLVGVEEMETTLIAYPNPVNDNLNIITNDASYLSGCTITLVDGMGRTVQQLSAASIGGNTYQLDLSTATTGIYNVVFTAADGNVMTKQIVKN